jgi:hypothetical protein
MPKSCNITSQIYHLTFKLYTMFVRGWDLAIANHFELKPGFRALSCTQDHETGPEIF